MITAAFLITILFLGGWHLPWITGTGGDIGWAVALLRMLVLLAKIVVVILFFMLVRWSWPRFRFDQLMALAWKVMLPLGVVNLLAVAVLERTATIGFLGRIVQRVLGGAERLGCRSGRLVDRRLVWPSADRQSTTTGFEASRNRFPDLILPMVKQSETEQKRNESRQ